MRVTQDHPFWQGAAKVILPFQSDLKKQDKQGRPNTSLEGDDKTPFDRDDKLSRRGHCAGPKTAFAVGPSFPALVAGTRVFLSGVVYTARDAAHKRIVEALDKGIPLPFDLRGQVIYYAGPCPPAPGQVIGALGPTTSGRMDPYAPRLLQAGLGGMIGKGKRSKEVRDSVAKYGSVYFVTIGGAGALLSKTVKKADLVAYPDLGPEAVYRLEIEGFPAIVGIDPFGNDIYERRNQ